MKFKPLAAASMAVALMGLGIAPAQAAPPKDREVEHTAIISADGTDSAVLIGPGGSFGIGQNQPGNSSRSPVEEETFFAQDGGDLTLKTSMTSSLDNEIEYLVDIPASASIRVVTNDRLQESVMFLNAERKLLGGLAATKVTDASGRKLDYSFAVDGGQVTQKVATTATTKYPVSVTAATSTVWYTSAWVVTSSRGYIVNANPTALGRIQIDYNVHYVHVAHLKSILGTQAYRVNSNIESQFLCHVVGARFNTGVYNMESWQPNTALAVLILPWVRCNMT